MPNDDGEQNITFTFTVKYQTFARPSRARAIQQNIQNMLDLQMTRETHGLCFVAIKGEDGYTTKTAGSKEEPNAPKRYAGSDSSPTQGV